MMEKMEKKPFIVTVEVVPPASADPAPLLKSLEELNHLSTGGFSVATNPVAKPRMCAMALCSIIEKRTRKPAVLHCTPRDHNRLSLQGLLWGAVALGIKTVLIASGDRVSMKERGITTPVEDIDLFRLISMAREAGLTTGVVLDPRPEINGLSTEIKRLWKKVEAGAQFAVTQPVYDEETALSISRETEKTGIPVIMGILPLRTHRHAEFLHHKVGGIAVPEYVRRQMAEADDSISQGVVNASHMLTVARDLFQGACLMPPFDHFEVMPAIMDGFNQASQPSIPNWLKNLG